MKYTLVLLVLSIVPVVAQADECSETFPARVADAKQAIVRFEAFSKDYEQARPALEWFEAHCRFLGELERVVRKLDDPNAFVCNPKAKGRPKSLTAELVMTYSVAPDVGSFQSDAFHDLNNRCLELDQAARVGLVFGAISEKERLAQRLEVACYGDDRPECVKALEAIAAWRAKKAP